MRPRKASLRVAHARSCPNASKTALSSVGRSSGCTCQPSYWVFHRDRFGKPVKGERVRDRQTAERSLDGVQREIDEGRVGLARPRMTVDDWLTKYQVILEKQIERGERKPRTLRNYRGTWKRARDAFGTLYLDEIEEPELRRLYDALPATLTAAARHRVLRELSAAFAPAVRAKKETGLTENPVPGFIKSLGLRVPKRGKAPFDPDELPRLYVELAKAKPVYLHAAKFATEAGLRLGEIIGLDWSTVDLTAGTVVVEVQHNDARDGDVAPKDGTARTIYLTPYARQALEEWVKVAGVHTSGPVFPDPDPDPGTGEPRRLGRKRYQRTFEKAREATGIPKLHPTMRDSVTGKRLPRALHSLRYSTSILMQQRGYHPRLIEATLGHSSLELTYGVYGGWGGDMLAAEAARDPAQH